MSHLAHVSLIRNKRVIHFTDRWMGARVLDALVAGPDQCELLIATLTTSKEVSLGAEAGWLVDFDAQRLIAFGDVETTYVGDEDQPEYSREELRSAVVRAWSGFSIVWAQDARAVQEYVEAGSFASASTPEVPANDERLDDLRRDEDALGPISVKGDATKASWTIVFLFVVVVIAGFVTRVLTLPFRSTLQSRAERKVRAFRDECDRRILALTAFLQANPSHAASRFERAGLEMAMIRLSEAEADYDACVRYFEERDRGDEAPGLALALHNRGVARKRLGYPKLGAADQLRASELGFVPAQTSTANRLWLPLYFTFRRIAGLNPRDDS